MLRVRQIVDPLVPVAEQLLADGILPPNIELLFNCSKTVKYPPFVYELLKKHKWAFSHFGFFMEYLLRKMLNKENWKDQLYTLYIDIAKEFTKDDVSKLVSKADLTAVFGRFVNIEKWITEEFAGSTFLFDQHCMAVPVIGHPDLITTNFETVYDVKTATNFNGVTVKGQAILQISAYLALARAEGYNPQEIGIVLPFQQTVLRYDLRYAEYDHLPFLKLLHDLAQVRICTLAEKIELQTFMPIIGHHTLKIGGSVHKSLQQFYQTGNFDQPCQLFLRGNRGAKSITVSDMDIATALAFVEEHRVKFFVHSTYTINLCHPCGIKTKDDSGKEWAIDCLREDLKWTSVCGGRGVVVHTGKGIHLSESEALDKMYASVLSVLDTATEECPLLIETPVDKGTELCGTAETLAAFYLRFTAEQRKRLKLCVDTCHVFAAGYQPYEYLIKISELVGANAIALIHLNDAQWAKNSGHDGHAWVGTGCIGMTEMLKAIRWCAAKGIPMVYE